MKIDPQAPGARQPVEPIHSDEAQQDRDEFESNDPKKWRDDQNSVDNELEKLHDKARPLTSR